MRCPECKSEVSGDMKFCWQCGCALERICPNCQSANPPHSKFCIECGQQLTTLSATQQERRFTSHGERKHITVIFSDLSGYTSLSEKLDPEEIKNIMNRIFSQVTEVVSHYEGTIEKFIGDAVVAFFGIPRAHEDDPVRAIRTAIKIHEIVRDISPEFEGRIGRQIAMHTGINSGLVVTGKLPSEEEAMQVAGDSVNVASRLSGFAKSGEIIVGEATYHQAKDYFVFKACDPARLKGKAQLVTPYRVIEEKATFGRTQGLATQGISSPLVGRDAEFVAMKGCVNRLLEGQGGILSIIGGAGLGKSRLVSELRNSSFSGTGSLRWLEGHTLSYGQKITYWPFREIVKQYSGITDDDNDTEAWEKLKGNISKLFPLEAEEILPYLAGLATLDIRDEYEERLKYLDGEAMGRQVFLASRRFFERLAQDLPLVVVFEDLHWADESSIQLLEHLFPLVNRVPILICVVSRPEANIPVSHLRETAKKDYDRRFTEIRLEPLSQAESVQLMQNLLEIENLPTRLREAIIHKTEGNPFFLEEIMRSLIDGAAVVHDPKTGLWKTVPKIETIIIPDTIHGVIMARVDRLDEEAKKVLRSASVIGRSFLYRILKAMNEEIARLDQRLKQLEDMGLISQKQKIPELEYIFKHSLVQELTYESILLQKRRELHAQVAQIIEALFSGKLDEFYSVLAHHYALGETWDKAQDYLFKAGDQAGRIAGDTEALAHYEQAVKAYTRIFGDKWDTLQRASLERKMGEALYRQGKHEQATQYLQRALGYLGKPLPTSSREIGLATIHEIFKQIGHRLMPSWFVKQMDESVSPAIEEEARLYEAMSFIALFNNPKLFLLTELKALNFSERNGFLHGTVKGYGGLGVIASILFFFRIGGYYARKSAALAEQAKIPELLGDAYLSMSAHMSASSNMRSSVEYSLKAAECLRKGGYWNLRLWGTCLRMAAMTMNSLGNFDAALRHALDLARFGEDSNDRQIWCWGLAEQGVVERGLGRVEEAISNLQKAVDLAVDVFDYAYHLRAGAYLADCYLLRGNFDRARALLEECDLIGRQHKVIGPIYSFIINGLAKVYVFAAEQNTGSARTEWLKKAEKESKRSLKLGKAFKYCRVDAMLHQGTCEWLNERPASAKKWWQQSLSIANEIGMRYRLGITHLEMGRRLQDRNHLEQAETIFVEIGAEFDLAETRKFLQALDNA
jgi:class 3 adenylate cyclase/tetratricopeptide (TPR) repeat protein